jgi:hypothetical protein
LKARRIRAFIEHFSLLSKHPPSADGLRHRVIVYFSGEDLEDIGDFDEMGREIEIEIENEKEFGGERAIFRNYVLWFSLYLFIVFNL